MKTTPKWALSVVAGCLALHLQGAPDDLDKQMIVLGEEGRITVYADDRPLKAIVDAFSHASGASIITADPRILENFTVSANLQDVEWEPALKDLLGMHQLDLVEQIPGTEVYTIVPQDGSSSPETHTEGGVISLLVAFGALVFMQALTTILNTIFAVAVFIDARRLRRAHHPTRFVPPALWGLAVLGTGLLGVGLYWMIHYSTLRGTESQQRAAHVPS